MDSCLNNDQFREVVLIAGIDGRRISARVSMLVESSDYFAAMFTGSLRESTAKEVILEEVSGDFLELLVHYSHTGHLELQEEVVNKLLVTAHFLQFNTVVTLCSNFIIQQLNSSNCHEFALFAKAYNFDFLLKRITSFINANFMEICETSEFLDLDNEDLAELITRDDINVLSDDFVFFALKTWIEHDPVTRKKHIPELLPHVRLPQLRPEYILENVEPLCNTKEMQLYMMEALKYNMLPNHKWIYAEKLLKPRKPQKLLLAISSKDCSIEVYNRTKWTPLTISLNKRRFFDAVVMNDKLFIIGGTNYVDVIDDVDRMDGMDYLDCYVGGFTEDTIESVCMTTMQSEMFNAPVTMSSGHSSVHCNGSIYVLGGLENNGSNLFQIWSSDDQKWVSEKPPHIPRYDNAAICVLGEDVYVVGGEASYRVKTNVVESFNIRKKVWEPRAPMNLARCCHGLAVVNNCLYAIGGLDREAESIERYDPVTNNWTLIPAPRLFLLPSCFYTKFSCTVINNRIYVGGDGHILREYNPATNLWRKLKPPAAESFRLVAVPNVIPEFYY